MNNPLMIQYSREPWMMEPTALTQFLALLGTKRAGAALVAIHIEYKLPLRIEGDTAVVPISGVLLKTVPDWLRFWGLDVTGYDEIRKMMKMALADDQVRRIELRITSPGGMLAGGMETGDAIRAADAAKEVTAVIEDLGASGAYWLAASARRIEANANAEVGSIGVYMVYYDWSKAAEMDGIKAVVIRSGEHKGMGVPGAPITDVQIAAMQEVIDGMNGHFIDQVAAGRRVPREQAAAWATGRVWLASAALELGLIDAITQSVDANTNSSEKENMMAEQIQENPRADIEAIQRTTGEQVLGNERKRVADLRAAFPSDAGFALEAIEKGWTVTEAKAERHDRQQKAAAAAPPGDKGVQYHDSDQGGGPDFMAEAKRISREEKMSMTDAMRRVQADDPGSYEKFRAAESVRPVRHRSGKAAAGRVSL